MNSLSEKQLRVTIILAGTNQVFPGTNNNTLVLTDLRVSAKVKAVARLATQADIKIYGMQPALMDALTVVWANPPIVLDHVVILEAKETNDPDPNRGWSQVFKGTIIEGQPEYRGAPEVYFHLLAVVGYFQKINAAPPTSYPGSVEADVLLNDIISDMGFDAEIAGNVQGTLTNPYFYGTKYDQLVQACAALGADFYVNGDVVVVTASGQPRTQQVAVVLNKDSGLIGYPVFERAGLVVDAIYNPAFASGLPIDLTSSVPSATGRWYPYALTHTLETKTRRAKWQTHMNCLRVLV